MTREERRLLEACRAAGNAERVADSGAVCRHGWPLPIERVSRKFRDADGNEHWSQVYVTNKEATCPDR